MRPKGYTKTEKVIHDMLLENTGMAMMDSGGYSGRNWQRNQSIVDFREMPVFDYEWDGSWFNITKSLFHHINESCEFDPIENKKFVNWCKRNEESSDCYSAEEYFEQNGWSGSHTDNSYNYENLLSQVIQYTTCFDKLYLTIHGGADVRGGYTDVKVFDYDSDMFYMMSDCRLECKCGDVYSDDCGNHWYDGQGFGKDGIPSFWTKHLFRDKLQCKICKQIVETV